MCTSRQLLEFQFQSCPQVVPKVADNSISAGCGRMTRSSHGFYRADDTTVELGLQFTAAKRITVCVCAQLRSTYQRSR